MTFDGKHKKVETYYSICSSNTGEFLRITPESNEGGYACNSFTWTLDYEGEFPYKAEKYIDALYALTVSTPWYNSSEIHPVWGYLDTEDDTFYIVKVTETVEISKPCEIYPLAPSPLEDLYQVVNVPVNLKADINRRLFIMKGGSTSRKDYPPGKFVFRNSDLWKIVKNKGYEDLLKRHEAGSMYAFIAEKHVENT